MKFLSIALALSLVVADEELEKRHAILSFFPARGPQTPQDVGCAQDLSRSYFDEYNQSSLDACKTFCIYNVNCTGIEYAVPSVAEVGGRCRVWKKPQGLEVTVDLIGFSCWKYNHTISAGHYCSRWVRVGTCQRLHGDCYKCLQESPLN
ncbi:unnamed protein product [Durusdinium trenchii]|uniref:Uncharacterized protein n=1 Tax=Durusdinium trenchii TaxID=1381693 RepID=A0ABP0L1Z7_9DINO